MPRVESWLREHIAGFAGPLEIVQFPGGQSNPTYDVRAASGRYVLRRKPPGTLLPSAHAVEREFRVQQALFGSSVPVARPYALCEDPSVLGTPFYVMDYAAGRIFWDMTLPDVPRAERAAIYDAMNATIAALHQLDYRALGLEDYGRPANYVARQIDRWTKQYRASETTTIAAMDELVAWLPAHVPAEAATTIVHGDFRIDNVIFHPTEPRVVAVIDWELSTLGDPLADFACHAMAWRVPTDLYHGLGGIDVGALGIPSEAEYVEAYRRHGGRVVARDWSFYLTYGLFRFAAILQGVYKRGLDGNASSERALDVGARAARFAELAWTIARA